MNSQDFAEIKQDQGISGRIFRTIISSRSKATFDGAINIADYQLRAMRKKGVYKSLDPSVSAMDYYIRDYSLNELRVVLRNYVSPGNSKLMYVPFIRNLWVVCMAYISDLDIDQMKQYVTDRESLIDLMEAHAVAGIYNYIQRGKR